MNNFQFSNVSFVFFGSSRLSTIVLDELIKFDLKPSLIVTTPDKPQGRKLEIKSNVVKKWATSHHIPVLDPTKLDAGFIDTLKRYPIASLKIDHWPLFIVASYGKIIPRDVIELPTRGTLNIHPSLLPHYRGASPLPTAILGDTKKTGVTIMQLDSEMDHGPIVAQKEIEILHWPTYEEFEEMMAIVGAHLLVQVLPDWIAGTIKAKPQDHSKATYTKKISKTDGLIEFTRDELKNTSTIPPEKAYEIFRKIQAFHEWPQVYFFIEHNGTKIRVKITQATYTDSPHTSSTSLIIEKVIPEGKKEIAFDDFIRGYIK